MKKMKKWISAILSIAMVAGLLSSPAVNAQAVPALPDIVSDSGWSINVDMAAFATLLYGAENTGIFEGDCYLYGLNEIGEFVSVSGLDFDYISEDNFDVTICVYDETEGEYLYYPTYIDGDSKIALCFDIDTILGTEKGFKGSTYLSKLTTNATIITEACFVVEYSTNPVRSYADVILELGTVDEIFSAAYPDIVSPEGWSLDFDLDNFRALLDGKTNSGIFEDNVNYTGDPEIVERYLGITGLDMEDILGIAIGFLVYDDEIQAYDDGTCDIDENSKVAVGVQIVLSPVAEKQFKKNTYLAKMSTNGSLLEEESSIDYYEYSGPKAQYVFITLELGTVGNILDPTPTPPPTPDPTYVEWNTDDPNVTKLMWHGGRDTYATITETKDSTEVKFTGIGWFSIPDVLDGKFQESGKDTNVTYPYKGYTVSVKIPAGKVKRTGAAWYGPEYFPSLYMEEGYVTVTDYLGREVDPQVIITKKN